LKVLQINTTINTGSTGRIAEEIGKLLISSGHKSHIAYGRGNRPSESKKIKIGTKFGQVLHLINTRLFDRHGLSSSFATKHLIKRIEKIAPDIIHLHNLHGYYINYHILFHYLKELGKPVVWTLHDCWAFTGHCAHFERIECNKWQTECSMCPLKSFYPSSIFIDRSKKNYHQKKTTFNVLKNMHIVTPSKWLATHVSDSFLKDNPVYVINNGIDLKLFNILKKTRAEILKKYNLSGKKILLGVANTWKRKKAFDDFIKLSLRLDENYQIILIGLRTSTIKKLPRNITGIERTENIDELVEYYNAADVFINPTYADTIPTTNIEALACGTPVISYKTGGSSETINEETGIGIVKGNINELRQAVDVIIGKGKSFYSNACRKRAEKYFNEKEQFQEYINLYERLIKNS
jgi:glycosyltransferase involved in cell wall biosynthesis